MIYAVLNSYAERDRGAWLLRAEDIASARRKELSKVSDMLESLGRRLEYSTIKRDKLLLWQENGQTAYAFHLLASALVGRALSETWFPPNQTIIVLPGGRASLASPPNKRKNAKDSRFRNGPPAPFTSTPVPVSVLVRFSVI